MTPPRLTPPFRFSLGPLAEVLSLTVSGPRQCTSSCSENVRIDAFGPGVGLGLSTLSSPGFLFEGRFSAAYHWGNFSRRTTSSAGTLLSEDSGSDSIGSVGAHIGLGASFPAFALYGIAEFLFAASATTQTSGFSFGPGFGLSLGPNRLVNLEAVVFPFFSRDGFPDDQGNGFAIRGMLDLMALLHRPKERPQELPQGPISTAVLRPPARLPEPIRLPEEPPPTIRIEGHQILYTGDIHFEYNSALIRRSDDSYRTIGLVARFLTQNPQIRMVEIHGHTDDRGSDPYNDSLSFRRASAVRRALIDRGISPNRLVAFGHGERQPRASNETIQGRALNRRVEFRVVE